MIVPVKELLLSFPVLLLALFIIGATGYAAARLIRREKNTRLASLTITQLFRYIFTGLCLIISIYAIIVTKFRTCLLPVPLIVVLLIRCFDNDATSPRIANEMKGKQLLLFASAALITYWLCFGYCFISLGDEWVKFVSSDVNFYGRIADRINQTGIENTSLDYFGLVPPFHEPYHYGDIWLAAMLMKCSGLHPSVATSLCVYPLLALLFTCGLATCLTGLFRQRFSRLQQVVLIASILTNGLIFLFPSFLVKGDTSIYSLIVYPKLLIPAIILTALMYAVRQRRPDQLIYLCILGTLLYTPIGPSLAIAATCILSRWFVKDRTMIRHSYLPAILAVGSAIYLYTFYHYEETVGYYNFSNPELSGRTMLNIILEAPLHVLPIIPFILLGYYGFRQGVKQGKIDKKSGLQLVALLLLFFVIGVLAYALLFPLTVESVQFCTNVVLPVFSVQIAFALISMLTIRNNLLHAGIFLLLIFSISFNKAGIFWVHRIKWSDLTITKNFLRQDTNQKGNFVTLKSTREVAGFIGTNTEFDLPLIFIDYLRKPYINVTLNTPSSYVKSSDRYRMEEKTILGRSSYSQYVTLNRDSIPEHEMMLSFLQRYHMRYFCVSPDTILPVRIRPLATDSIRLESGWNIYRINP